MYRRQHGNTKVILKSKMTIDQLQEFIDHGLNESKKRDYSGDKMKRIELSINKDYVTHWGIWEAVRELLQNAIDTQHEEIIINKDSLTINSSGGKIPLKSLLLGGSSKKDDPHSIGKFGEGMKLAFLVLCRMNKDFTFVNYDETWKPVIEFSETFQEDCLAVYIKETEQTNNVSVQIPLTDEEYLLISENYLERDTEHNAVVKSGYGYALEKDCDFRAEARVYVNGLFIGEVEGQYKFDYNFVPEVLELDRDRQTVSEFNLQWETTRLITDSLDVDLLSELSSSEYDDVKYFGSARHWYSEDKKDELAELAIKRFFEKYGDDALPVNSSWSMQKKRLVSYKIMGMGKRPVEVRDSLYFMFNDYFDDSYRNVEKIVRFKPVEFFEDFLQKYGRELRAKPKKKIESVLADLKIMEGK